MGDVVELHARHEPTACTCGWSMPVHVGYQLEAHTLAARLAKRVSGHLRVSCSFECPQCTKEYRVTWEP